MISLARAIRSQSVEHLERRCHTILACYTGLLKALEENIPPIDDACVSELRETLRRQREDLQWETALENLQDSVHVLQVALQEYRTVSCEFLSQKERDAKEVIKMLANAAILIRSQADNCHQGIQGFVKELEGITRLPSVADIRAKLSSQVAVMRKRADAIRQESQRSMEQLQSELKQFRDRLEATERLASTDPLTGALNRRAGDRVLLDKASQPEPFSIALFDLDLFKSINDRFGHQCGDRVLKTFAARLASQAVPGDVVCRWGGDEFLVILQCGLQVALERTKRLSEAAGEPYYVESGRGEQRFTAKASSAVAERRAGETPEQLFARADVALFEKKKQRTGTAALRVTDKLNS